MTFFKNLVKGFTLVELLVVMGILAVLAAGLIALINPADRINQANDTKVMADLNQIVSGLQAYAAANGGLYPVLAAGSNVGDGTSSATAGFGPLQNLITAEVQSPPTSVSGYTYSYNCAAAGPCKVAVELKSKRNTNAANTLGSICWLSTTGTSKSITSDGTTGAVCP